jgi:hypothetical protein
VDAMHVDRKRDSISRYRSDGMTKMEGWRDGMTEMEGWRDGMTEMEGWRDGMMELKGGAMKRRR